MSCRRLTEPVAGFAAVLVALALASGASAVQPDEPRDLRVRKATRGAFQLDWQPPDVPAESYVVRRCAIGSLGGGRFGACVAEGLVGTTFTDRPPDGSWYWLVSAVVGGTERTLGGGWDGASETPRPATPCTTPPDEQELVLVLSAEGTGTIGGAQANVRFVPGTAAWVSGQCTGIAAAFEIDSGGTAGAGEVFHACGTASSFMPGPGEFARITLRWSGCAAADAAFHLVACDVVDAIGNPLPGVGCSLRME